MKARMIRHVTVIVLGVGGALSVSIGSGMLTGEVGAALLVGGTLALAAVVWETIES